MWNGVDPVVHGNDEALVGTGRNDPGNAGRGGDLRVAGVCFRIRVF